MFKTLVFQPENGFLAGEKRLFLDIFIPKCSKIVIYDAK